MVQITHILFYTRILELYLEHDRSTPPCPTTPPRLYCRHCCHSAPLDPSTRTLHQTHPTSTKVNLETKIQCKYIHGRIITANHVFDFSILRYNSDSLRVHSHLRFIRRELLHQLFSPHNHKKWVHNPLQNFSVHAKVDQIASVNAPPPLSTVQAIIKRIVHA